MKTIIATIFLASLLAFANAHTYKLGDCPIVEPVSNFDMNRFLGYWYVIQKTSTSSRCIAYNYTRGPEPGKYVITQDSDHPILSLTRVDNKYHYTGELTVPERSTPARMQVRFPLSVAGSASHVIFATDYDNYAGIFTCQKLPLGHRHSATILSRTKELEKSKVDALRAKLNTFGVDSFDLSIISQIGCGANEKPVDIDINPSTFSSESIGNFVRKAGSKIGDGVEWVANAGSKIYHKITGTESSTPTNDNHNHEREPVTPVNHHGRIETNEVEWIP